MVRTYRKIRQSDDVELVLFSSDKTEEAAKAWAKEERMKFPIIKPKKGNDSVFGHCGSRGKDRRHGTSGQAVERLAQVLQGGGRKISGSSPNNRFSEGGRFQSSPWSSFIGRGAGTAP